ncbi:metallophosphoesterase family protein [Niveibacterium umoris]|uniref:Putative phosphodiesterase n=1 Tax=Niveibacterium umoris TaxID=1193620 RepID=A0A840BI81_9RHOO|nr:metallophosphoesterase family protein [Niveibacterium umoris]MBB4012935.1 putative phosphodiesterase [Niveibacterium umoris]
MKLALLADIHSNIEALDACLAHAQAQGVEGYVLLGDLVGYGADPGAVIDRVIGLGDAVQAAVLGNHDAAVVGRGDEPMNDEAHAAIIWTIPRLTPAQRSYLAQLPLVQVDGDATWVHASADQPEAFNYVASAAEARASLNAAGTRYVFSGHVHDPTLYYVGADGRLTPFLPTPDVAIPVGRHRSWLGIVGSCGQPRDGKTGAWYALFDRDRSRLSYHRVPYDSAAAAAKIRRAGLPDRFAQQIEGIC